SDLKPTDIITAVDGRPVATAQQLRGEIRGKKIGRTVTLDVFRQGKAIQVKVSPGESAEPMKVASAKRDATADSESNKLGATVHGLTPELARQFGVEQTEGVIIMSVEKGMPAELKGLKAGDVITSLNQQSVKNSKEFREALRKADLKKGIIVNVIS